VRTLGALYCFVSNCEERNGACKSFNHRRISRGAPHAEPPSHPAWSVTPCRRREVMCCGALKPREGGRLCKVISAILHGVVSWSDFTRSCIPGVTFHGVVSREHVLHVLRASRKHTLLASRNLIWVSIYDTYSGSMKTTARLNYITHCETASGTNG